MSLESCPICLEEFKNQIICTPNTCLHKYCFNCLKKWASIHYECPLCRQDFTDIITIDRNPRNLYIPREPYYYLRPRDQLNESEDDEAEDRDDDSVGSPSLEESSDSDYEFPEEPRYNLRPRPINQIVDSESDSD